MRSNRVHLWTFRSGSLVLMLLALTCCGSGQPTPSPSPDMCAGWSAIRLSPATIRALTDDEAMQIDAHDRQGRKMGCW